jgi:hypothetical protein
VNENQPKNNEYVKTFNAKDLGQSLREVAVDVIRRDDKDIESRWFHSNKDADLFIWSDEKKNILKQQVTFYGQVVEWNVVEGLRTGLLIEDETSQGMSASPLIRYDISPQKHTIEQSIDIVGHIGGLSSLDKSQVIINFTKASIFSELSPEEILKRFGIEDVYKHKDNWILKMLKSLGLVGKKK